jgi:hypothetical protein
VRQQEEDAGDLSTAQTSRPSGYRRLADLLRPQSNMMFLMARGVKLGLCLMAAALFYGGHAWAHHSFASTFLDTTVTIESRVVEFLFRSPHSAVLVETIGEGRQPVTWAVEWNSAGQLSRQGIEKDTLKAGDHVIITGNPSRNSGERRLRMVEITRPSDGWTWKSSPP